MKAFYHEKGFKRVIVLAIIVLVVAFLAGGAYLSVAQSAVTRRISIVHTAFLNKILLVEALMEETPTQQFKDSILKEEFERIASVQSLQEELEISAEITRKLENQPLNIKNAIDREDIGIEEAFRNLNQEIRRYHEKITRFPASIFAHIYGFNSLDENIWLSTEQYHSAFDDTIAVAVFIGALVFVVFFIRKAAHREDQVDLKIPMGYPPPNPGNGPFGSGGFVVGGCIEADRGSSTEKDYLQ